MLGPSDALGGWVCAFAEEKLRLGDRVFVVQFLSGSVLAPLLVLAARHARRLEVRAMGPDNPSRDVDSTPVNAKWAADGVSLAARALRKGAWDHVVLLEVDAVARLGLVEPDRILELVDHRPEERGLFFCCTEAFPDLSEVVDQVIHL